MASSRARPSGPPRSVPSWRPGVARSGRAGHGSPGAGPVSPPDAVPRTPSPSPGAARSTRPGNLLRIVTARHLGLTLPAGVVGSPRGGDRREPPPECSRTPTCPVPNRRPSSRGRGSVTARQCVLRIPESRRSLGRHASYCLILRFLSSHSLPITSAFRTVLVGKDPSASLKRQPRSRGRGGPLR
jgi:hypothetical protein